MFFVASTKELAETSLRLTSSPLSSFAHLFADLLLLSSNHFQNFDMDVNLCCACIYRTRLRSDDLATATLVYLFQPLFTATSCAHGISSHLNKFLPFRNRCWLIGGCCCERCVQAWLTARSSRSHILGRSCR